MKALLSWVRSPFTEMGIGLVMFLSGLTELIAELREAEEFGIGAHHGVMLFGFFAAVRAMAEAVEGARKIEDGLVEKTVRRGR